MQDQVVQCAGLGQGVVDPFGFHALEIRTAHGSGPLQAFKLRRQRLQFFRRQLIAQDDVSVSSQSLDVRLGGRTRLGRGKIIPRSARHRIRSERIDMTITARIVHMLHLSRRYS